VTLIAIIDNPGISGEDLMAHVPGPDFPTGGIIYGRGGIREAYTTGRGLIRVRARVMVEKDKHNQTETLVITELPYQVNKAKLVEKIAELLRDKQLDGVKYIRDESDREGMRIALGMKKDGMAPVIINQLYKHTRMETTFGVIFLALVNNRPELLTLRRSWSISSSTAKTSSSGAPVSSWPRPRPAPTFWKASRSPWTTWMRWWR
jgi:DNA gyrase subunit A